MHDTNPRALFVFIADLLVALIAIGSVIVGVAVIGEGAAFFCMYTRLSNVLAAIACGLSLPYDLRAIRSEGPAGSCASLRMPHWLQALRLTGFATVMVTFLTVFLLFGFFAGHLSLLQDTNFFFHLVSPLLIIASSILGRISVNLPCKAIALPVALTAAYAFWYFVEVLVIGEAAGGWSDFYGFNTGGMWPVSLVAMMAATVLVSFACWKLSKGR